MNSQQLIWWLALFALLSSLVSGRPVRAEMRAEASTFNSNPTATALMQLRLKNNSVAIGRLVPCDKSGVLAWQNEGFAEPFLFDINSIRSVSRSYATHLPLALNQNFFQVETTNGEVLVGKITALDQHILELESSLFGPILIERSQAFSLMKVQNFGEVVYPGLAEEKVWTALSSTKDWQFHSGTLRAQRQGAGIVGDVRLPSQCKISLSLTWKGVPDFVIHLGTVVSQKKSGPMPAAARLEVWNRNVVLVRETQKDADLVRLMELNEQHPQVELNILLDQESGNVLVQDFHGRQLGSVNLLADNPQARPAIHIYNHGPNLTVERLEVRRWDGVSYQSTGQAESIVLKDGNQVAGQIVGCDENAEHFIVRDPEGNQLQLAIPDIAFAQLASADLHTVRPNQSEAANEFEVVLVDNTRLRCQWTPGNPSKISFNSVALDRGFEVDTEHVASIAGNSQSYSFPITKRPSGILTIGKSELTGYLADDENTPTTSILRWHPHGSLTSSSWLTEAEGQIVFSHRLFPDHWPSTRPGEPTGRLNWVDTAEQSRTDPRDSGAESVDSPQNSYPQVTRQIHFLSGDTIDGFVKRIDQDGVHFQSDQTQVCFVEHSRINNLWLNSLSASNKPPPEDKLKRLMVVPRMWKDDPPTHLLLSVNGDWLRCRLIALNQQSATVEIHRGILAVPRDQIAQIVWLHQREWTTGEDSDGDDGAFQAIPTGRDSHTSQSIEAKIHVVQHDRGITFVPTTLQANELSGISELLGQCRVLLRGIDRILFGPRLDQRIAEAKASPWALTLAHNPRSVSEGRERSTLATQFPLVGQPAPSFVLPCLDGHTVHSSNLLGRVVVVDFWASWCSACVKTLPQFQQILGEFDPAKITFVAINVQEATPRVQSSVEQLQLSVPIAMDTDGSVAARYLATSIPHTFIIDSEGIIRYVYSGDVRPVLEIKQAIELLVH